MNHRTAPLEVRERFAVAAAEPERCAILTAVFGHGEVIETEFPEHLPTFGN